MSIEGTPSKDKVTFNTLKGFAVHLSTLHGAGIPDFQKRITALLQRVANEDVTEEYEALVREADSTVKRMKEIMRENAEAYFQIGDKVQIMGTQETGTVVKIAPAKARQKTKIKTLVLVRFDRKGGTGKTITVGLDPVRLVNLTWLERNDSSADATAEEE